MQDNAQLRIAAEALKASSYFIKQCFNQFHNWPSQHLVDFANAALVDNTVALDSIEKALAAPQAPADALYVEARECNNCQHVGINDEHQTDAACNMCSWSGPSPKEDHCPGCGQDGTMTTACPKCCHRYILLAEARLAAPHAQVQADEPVGCLYRIAGTNFAWKFEGDKELLRQITSRLDDGGVTAFYETMPVYTRPTAAVPTGPSDTEIRDQGREWCLRHDHMYPGEGMEAYVAGFHAARASSAAPLPQGQAVPDEPNTKSVHPTSDCVGGVLQKALPEGLQS